VLLFPPRAAGKDADKQARKARKIGERDIKDARLLFTKNIVSSLSVQ
jgi:hypothetical protein